MTDQQAFLLVSGSDTAPDTRQPQTLPAATGGRWNLIRTPARHLVRSPLLYFPAVLDVRFFEFYL
jgi:hypothetical protein